MAASSFRLWDITGMGNLLVRYGGGSSAATTDRHPWPVLRCRPALATMCSPPTSYPTCSKRGGCGSLDCR